MPVTQPKPVTTAAILKAKNILGFGLLLCSGLPACFVPPSASSAETLSRQLEQIAHSNTHFSLTVILQNQSLRLDGPSENSEHWSHQLAAAQTELANKLRAFTRQRESLAALLKSPNPKVRTLAMGALFQREDGRDLPMIAQLMEDPAATFPDLHPSGSSSGNPQPMRELESPQTVGQVDQAMIDFWELPLPERTVSAVQTYLKKNEGRECAASWCQNIS